MSIDITERIKQFLDGKCLLDLKDNLESIKVNYPAKTEIEKLLVISKLFSNKVRLKIILLLNQTSLPVCALAAILKKDQTLISHNIALLKKLGVIEEKRIKKYRFYSLKREKIISLMSDAIEVLKKSS